MDITTAIRSQMLGQLIAALGSGSAASAATAKTTTNLNAASLGQIFMATVMGEAGEGKLALQINGQQLTADVRGTPLPDSAKQPGAQIALKLDVAGDTPRLSFVGVELQGKAAPNAGANQPQLTATGTIRIVAATPAPTAEARQLSQADIKASTITQATREAAARQGSAAPLFADLATLAGKPVEGLPKAVTEIARLLLDTRLNGEAPIKTTDLKQAIAMTGLFSEAQAARTGAAPLDTKMLLTVLRDLVQPNAERSIPTQADAEPPRRDGALQAQRPALPTLPVEADIKTTVTTLGREAEQALERVKLHQIASLPDQRQQTDPTRPQQLSFELPIAFGQQTAMAGFRLEREKHKSAKTGQTVDSWGVRFAIDADVLGPVHAHVRLAGQTISVSLWAETPATHRAFVEAMPMLEAALNDNALDVGELMVFAGKPAETKAAVSGHFLDRRS
ncbi:MAG: flagellar hook-length control protein FliK [Beijerinckiaceae bacterium]